MLGGLISSMRVEGSLCCKPFHDPLCSFRRNGLAVLLQLLSALLEAVQYKVACKQSDMSQSFMLRKSHTILLQCRARAHSLFSMRGTKRTFLKAIFVGHLWLGRERVELLQPGLPTSHVFHLPIAGQQTCTIYQLLSGC